MEIRQLEALEEVVRTGSFAAAARARHITQPALWAQVKGLEQELGIRLFERAGRGVKATAACVALRPRLRVALDDVAALGVLAREIGAGREAAARLGTAASGVAHFFIDCFAALRAEHPQAPFPQVVPITLDNGLELLQRGALDLAALPRSGVHGYEGFPLYDLWPCVISCKRLSGATVDVRELDGVPLATLPKDSGLRTTLEHAAANARVRLRVVHEDRDARALLAFARSGLCTVVATNEIVDGVDPRKVARLVSGRTLFSVELALFWRSEAALSPAARALRDAIHRVAIERRRASRT